MHLATPQNAFTNRPARPLLQKFFRCAGQRLQRLAAHDIFHGGGAPKKAAGKNKKCKNTQLAAAVLEIKEP